MTKKGLSAAEQRRRIGASIRSIEDNVSGIRSELTARGSTVVADDDSNGGMDAKARKDGRRHSGPRPSLLKKFKDWGIKDWLGIAANILTIGAFVVAVVAIGIGGWQFDRSGPDYTWFMLDRMEPNVRIKADVMSTQSTFAMVLANSGRTEDTVISLSRDTKHAESMRICMPEFDRKGGYKAGSAVLNDRGSFSLAPGESKLLFAVAPRTSMTLTGQTDKYEEYRSESFEITGNLTVYSASGKTWTAKELHPDQRVIRHYEDLSGFKQAKKDCMSLVNKDMEVK